MARSINNSSNLTTVPNGRVDTCVSCLHMFPDIYVAGLMCSSLLSLPLRLWTLWLLASSAVIKKIDLLGLNLIVSDFLITLVNLFAMLDVFLFPNIFEYLWGVLFSLVTAGRPLFQCCICLERYLAVKHPIVFVRYRGLRYRAAMLTPLWFFVLVTCFVAVALCETQREYFTHLILFQCSVLLLILAINTFSSVSILRALKRPPPGVGRKGRGETGRNESDQTNKKAFIMCRMIQVYTVTCYLPIVVLVFGDLVKEQWFCNVCMFNLWHVLLGLFLFCFHHLRNMGKLSWTSCHCLK